MITIPVQLSDDLARRVAPLQDRLPEIIELGLRQIEVDKQAEAGYSRVKQKVLDAMASTGIVTMPRAAAQRKPRARRTPIVAGGRPASELIIAERHNTATPPWSLTTCHLWCRSRHCSTFKVLPR